VHSRLALEDKFRAVQAFVEGGVVPLLAELEGKVRRRARPAAPALLRRAGCWEVRGARERLTRAARPGRWRQMRGRARRAARRRCVWRRTWRSCLRRASLSRAPSSPRSSYRSRSSSSWQGAVRSRRRGGDGDSGVLAHARAPCPEAPPRTPLAVSAAAVMRLPDGCRHALLSLRSARSPLHASVYLPSLPLVIRTPPGALSRAVALCRGTIHFLSGSAAKKGQALSSRMAPGRDSP
jgi:hypothetical protein